MTTLPEDIVRQIEHDFVANEREQVHGRLQSLWSTSLNVGPDQLARSILILAAGKLAVVEEIFASYFRGDPRDVIVAAMAESGNSAHWGLRTFPPPIT